MWCFNGCCSRNEEYYIPSNESFDDFSQIIGFKKEDENKLFLVRHYSWDFNGNESTRDIWVTESMIPNKENIQKYLEEHSITREIMRLD